MKNLLGGNITRGLVATLNESGLKSSAKALRARAWPKTKDKYREGVASGNLRIYYMGVTKSGLVRFRCSSASVPGKFWHQYIRFLDFEDAIDLQEKGSKLTDRDIINLVMAGNLGIYCNDPSFLYSGWKYMAWAQGYGLRPETRPPDVKNPKQTGSICKHLLSLFRVMPFYMNRIVADFRKMGLLKNVKQGTGTQLTQGTKKRRKSFQPADIERVRRPMAGIPKKQK